MLTDAECRNATCPPEKKRHRLTDAAGLYLEISPGGSKRWFLKLYRDGKETRLALGSYPAIGLPAARKARDTAKLKKADGIDPIQARQADKLKAAAGSGDTFEETAREWLGLKRPNWSEAHFEREQRNVEKDLVPWLGKRKISGIEPVELLAAVKKVEDRGALDVAKRVLMTAGGVWAYALATGRADRIITQGLSKALKTRTKKNYPAITDPTELAGLLLACDAYKGGAVMRAGLKLAPILFQRPGNLRAMRWEDLDLERGLWHIPSEDMKRTKEQKLNGQAHVVPLPRQVVAVLLELQPLTGGREWVFPSIRKPKQPMSEAGITAALVSMGYKGRQSWHGFRATGRTILRQVLKYPADVIEAQLAHKGQITHGGAYDRATHQDERADMLQVWADYLDKLRTGADVIPFNKAA